MSAGREKKERDTMRMNDNPSKLDIFFYKKKVYLYVTNLDRGGSLFLAISQIFLRTFFCCLSLLIELFLCTCLSVCLLCDALT